MISRGLYYISSIGLLINKKGFTMCVYVPDDIKKGMLKERNVLSYDLKKSQVCLIGSQSDPL